MPYAEFKIGKRSIGPGHPAFIIAEISANHNQDLNIALKLVEEAAKAGADAVKFQTFTADSMTLNSNKDYFRIKGGTLWDGKTLYELYDAGHTPWNWHPQLKAAADLVGIEFFSSAFDANSVDLLESIQVPAHKVASPELVDIPLIKKMAMTGKPLIISTGMASLEEIQEAVDAAKSAGAQKICILKCTSAYPAPPEEMNLITLTDIRNRFSCLSGLSDHTIGISAPIVAVTLGANVIEKHFTLSRDLPTADRDFSLEPKELTQMIREIRDAEKSIGKINYSPTTNEIRTKQYRRSIFVVKNIKAGEIFSKDNIRSIRPAFGLAPKHFDEVIGKTSSTDIEAGTPLSWSLIKE